MCVIAGDSALDGASSSVAQQGPGGRVDHSMRAMDAMLSYGDHQQVIAGIHENVHSIEVRFAFMLRDYLFMCALWLYYMECWYIFFVRLSRTNVCSDNIYVEVTQCSLSAAYVV